jgi:hypothetical protein
MIDWLTKQISKQESVVNNNKKEVKKAKGEQEQEEEQLARENTYDYIRKNSLC